MNRVDDRIAIVTGAAGGIGTATCRLLAEGGAQVIATDQKAAPGEALGAAIDAAGGRIRYLRHDVTDDAQWGAVLETTLTAHGRLDVLVNNAGIFLHGRTEDADAAAIDRLFDVNLKGVVLGTQHAFRSMKSRPRELPLASIVNLSSVAGMRANGVPPEQIDRMMAGAHSLGRMGLPEDVARGIVFLASDDAAFVTGTELVVDGGMTAR